MAVKYFIKDSNEEIKFGERIGLSYEKESECGAESAYMEFEFVPELVDMLLNDEVIIKKEIKSEDMTAKDKKEEEEAAMEFLDNLITAMDELWGKFRALSDRVKSLENEIKALKKKPTPAKKVARKVEVKS